MKMYGRVEIQVKEILISALDTGEWSVSCPCCFYSREIQENLAAKTDYMHLFCSKSLLY
jgi:hypothetical protein